jgi:PKD repeat protein
MKKHIQLISVAFCLIILNKINGQEIGRCGTTEIQQGIWNANPALYLEYLKEDARLETLDKQAYANAYKENSRNSGVLYIIPVVFHVIHTYGSENISDAQIYDAIRILNEDYQKRNADTSAIVPEFKSIIADCQIEFRLAKKDPNGNCTNGIDRIYSTLTNTADDNAKLNQWDRSRYLNVWVINTFSSTVGTGIAAYATPPGGPAAKDGVIIKNMYVGSIGTNGSTSTHILSHEIGHFFNLSHVWGNTNSPGVACGDDGVSDTPKTKGHTSCNVHDSTCTPGVEENSQNFMEYSTCEKMFTLGQKNRMHNALNSDTGKRDSLWTATNLTVNSGVSLPDVLCKADFTASFMANANNTICQGATLTFTDASWNGTPTAWTWSFSGGTPSTSTAASPVIQYNSAGKYDVSLTVTNASGTVSTTKTGYVIVNPSVASYSNAFYSESFENAAIPNTDWQVRNQLPGGNTWSQTTAAAATGSKSVYISNASTYDTYVDELISPSIDMTKITGTNPAMTFKVAHAQKASTGSGSADKLQVYISTNCGLTWTLRKTLTGTSLSTAGVNSTWTTPTSGEWVMQNVNLAGYVSQTNFYIMFRFTSNAGNNIYIDDINISGTTGNNEIISNDISFNIYPNPIEENTVIAVNLIKQQHIDIKITDVLGREITTLFNGILNEGEHQFEVGETNKLNPGIYFVKVMIGGQSIVKKMIVK